MVYNDYFPPPEKDGGWRTENPSNLGIDSKQLKLAINYHDHEDLTTSYGGSLIIVYKGHIIAETYVTGKSGGPQPWNRQTCNDVKSSTKSIFGTAVGAFLHEYKERINLDTPLTGTSQEDSLIQQMWDQPLTDERKKKIRVKHVLSMTSGHESTEPWLASSPRHHHKGYNGSFQMYEYCFGWWHFEGVPAQHTLLFEPGHGFNYSNFGLEQMALAMRNISGEHIGPYTYNRARARSRLGYLWLRRGRWNSKQLVPEDWMKQATTRFRQANGEAPMNYGYTFWIHDEGDTVPRDTFASRGHSINDCYIIPSLDLVIARQGNNNPPREQRNHFVKTLLGKIISALPGK